MSRFSGLSDRLIGWLRALGPMRVAILVVAALAQLVILAWVRLYVAGPDGGDICRDVVAMQRILHGQSPYARIAQCGTLFNVPHPPAYFLVIGPFALLPVAWAAALWDMVGIAALWASVALIVREMRLTLTPWALALLVALLLTWAPWLQTLLEAQISPLLLLLFTLAWLAARRGRSGWAGAALGIAAAVRLFPALAVVYFFIRRDWWAVGSAVAVFVGMELLATPLVGGIPGVIAYASREAPASTAEWIAHEHNVSLWGFTHQMLIGQRDLRPIVYAPWLASPLTYA
ncbi:MAG TPA: glycosyltransferase family 87 protein, partial [Ktedonobacterales bacterium]|nr:glycosyltransferase family 87 protein [Ktedonobacterales bacterium]